MIQHKDHFHGSDLEKIEQVYGIRREQITSFSANVNPLGISPRLRETLAQQIDAISSYPDRDYVALRRCIARYAGTDFENIIVCLLSPSPRPRALSTSRMPSSA